MYQSGRLTVPTVVNVRKHELADSPTPAPYYKWLMHKSQLKASKYELLLQELIVVSTSFTKQEAWGVW